jgi:predicted dehydrogenase
MVGMNHRYRPDVQIVRSFVQSGELGKVESVRGSWHVFRPGRPSSAGGQRRDQAGGGAMLDLGLSILDLGFWLGGSPAPVRVSACLDESGKERAVEQSGSAFVVCETGMSIFSDVTWHHLGDGERFGAGVRGSRGSAAIAPLMSGRRCTACRWTSRPAGRAAGRNAFTASYRAEWAHFEAAIAGEAKVPQPGGAPHAPPRGGRDLPLRPGRPRRGVVSRRFNALLLAALTLGAAPAGRKRARLDAGPPGSELTVYLMTMGPGQAGLGALRPQRDLDPRSRRTAR